MNTATDRDAGAIQPKQGPGTIGAMTPDKKTSVTAELSCEVCGQMPEAPKSRVTVAQIAVMLPVELLVHAFVVETELPYVAKVLLLTVTATVLVIWVAEPSAARILRRWIHAPALRHRRRLHSAPALWRARTVLRDQPGSLQRITQSLSKANINILGIHVHPMDGAVMDEFVLSAPGHLGEQDLLTALDDGGGRDSHAWPTTALAMADGQTKALSLAARIAENPHELPMAVAELLSAKIVTPGAEGPAVEAGAAVGPSTTLLKVPTAWHGPLLFSRPDEPFTPAESARAHRLAELAEILAHTRSTGSKDRD